MCKTHFQNPATPLGRSSNNTTLAKALSTLFKITPSLSLMILHQSNLFIFPLSRYKNHKYFSYTFTCLCLSPLPEYKFHEDRESTLLVSFFKPTFNTMNA